MAIWALTSEYINSFLSLPQEPTIPKIYIINKKNKSTTYDSVSIKVGIILSEKWTFLQTWIFLQHSVWRFWYKMCYQTKKKIFIIKPLRFAINMKTSKVKAIWNVHNMLLLLKSLWLEMQIQAVNSQCACVHLI